MTCFGSFVAKILLVVLSSVCWICARSAADQRRCVWTSKSRNGMESKEGGDHDDDGSQGAGGSDSHSTVESS